MSVKVEHPRQWLRSNWWSIVRVFTFSILWTVLIFPLVFVFTLTAQTAFDYNGAEVPWWLSNWVALSLMVIMLAPVMYFALREMKGRDSSE